MSPTRLKKLLAPPITQQASHLIHALQATAHRPKSLNDEDQLVTQAVSIIRHPETVPSIRRQLALQLEALSVLILGNLSPQQHVFNPNKVTYVDFHRTQVQLRRALRARIEGVEQDTPDIASRYPSFEKRGKCVAQLSFNISVTTPLSTQRTNIVLPISIGEPIHSLSLEDCTDSPFNGHAESALWSALSTPDHITSLLQRLKHAVGRAYSDVSRLKINAIVIQVSSTLRACDDCHTASLRILSDQIKPKFQQISAQLGMRIPSQSLGIGTAIQYDFIFSPSSRHSTHSYIRPLIYTEKRREKPNMLSNHVFIQRRGRSSSAPSTANSQLPHTLFVSNGPDHDSRALWFFTGEVNDRGDRDGQCDWCNTEIRYEHIIERYLTGDRLKIGSRCVEKYDEDIDILNASETPVPKESRKRFLDKSKRHSKLIHYLSTTVPDSPDRTFIFERLALHSTLCSRSAVKLGDLLCDTDRSQCPEFRVEKGSRLSFQNFSINELERAKRFFDTYDRYTALKHQIDTALAVAKKRQRQAEITQLLKRISRQLGGDWHLDRDYNKKQHLTFGQLRCMIRFISDSDALLLHHINFYPPDSEQLNKASLSQLRAIEKHLPNYAKVYFQKHRQMLERKRSATYRTTTAADPSPSPSSSSASRAKFAKRSQPASSLSLRDQKRIWVKKTIALLIRHQKTGLASPPTNDDTLATLLSSIQEHCHPEDILASDLLTLNQLLERNGIKALSLKGASGGTH